MSTEKHSSVAHGAKPASKGDEPAGASAETPTGSGPEVTLTKSEGSSRSQNEVKAPPASAVGAARAIGAARALEMAKNVVPDLKTRLNDPNQKQAAVTEVKNIRDQVFAAELPQFDELLEKWLKSLTPAEALEKVKALSDDISELLNAHDQDALAAKKRIRERVLEAQRPDFDKSVREWLNAA